MIFGKGNVVEGPTTLKNVHGREEVFKLQYSIINLHGDVNESEGPLGRVEGEVFSERWHLNPRAENEVAVQKPEKSPPEQKVDKGLWLG